MDIEEQIFKVCVHCSFAVNRGMVWCKQMVELDQADSNSFHFLNFQKSLSEWNILDDLCSKCQRDVTSFSNIPPIITMEGSILIIPQTLFIFKY